MRRVELARLLAGIGSKVAYKVFVDVAKHVIVLRTVGRNVLDELYEVLQGACLACRILAKLAQSCLQSLEDTVVDSLVVGADKAVEGVKCHR